MPRKWRLWKDVYAALGLVKSTKHIFGGRSEMWAYAATIRCSRYSACSATALGRVAVLTELFTHVSLVELGMKMCATNKLHH